MLVFYDSTQEGIISDPGDTDTQLLSASLTSASPYETLYLYTKDQSLLFNFYVDKNYFKIRTITDPVTFAANYNSPTTVTLP